MKNEWQIFHLDKGVFKVKAFFVKKAKNVNCPSKTRNSCQLLCYFSVYWFSNAFGMSNPSQNIICRGKIIPF